MKPKRPLSHQEIAKKHLKKQYHGIDSRLYSIALKNPNRFLGKNIMKYLYAKYCIRMRKVRAGKEAGTEHWAKRKYSFNFFADMLENYDLTRKVLGKTLGQIPVGAKVASIGAGRSSQEFLMCNERPDLVIETSDVNEREVLKKSEKISRREFPGAKLKSKLGSFEKIAHPENEFDFVMTIDAFHWAKDWEQTVSDMKLLLKKNSKGRIFILWRPEANKKAGRLKTLPLEDVKNELTERGFRILSAETSKELTGTRAVILAELK